MPGDHPAYRQNGVNTRGLKNSQLARAVSPTALRRLLSGAPTPLEALLAWCSLKVAPHGSPEQLLKHLCETPLHRLVTLLQEISLEASTLPAWFVRPCCKRLRKLMQQNVAMVLQDPQPHTIHRAGLHRPVGHTTLRDYVTGDPEVFRRRWQDVLTTARLLLHAQARHHHAFSTLFDTYHVQVFRGIRQYTASHADAEEIAQETWARVWETLPTYDPTRGNFAAFVMHQARLMRRRFYAASGQSTDLALLLQRMARTTRPDDALLLPVLYEELLHLAFDGSSPPHQTLAFGFCKLLEWTPRKVVAELSALPLRALATQLEADYLRVAQPPAARRQRLHAYFAPLHSAMNLPLGEVVRDDKTRRTHAAMLACLVGHTALEDYYRNKTNKQQAAADLSYWSYAVERRLKKTLQQ
jgi:DNA-directed RNA polymerase specialized sigma24 family protein